MTHDGFSSLDLGSVTSVLHSWWLYDFCDVYLEAIKPIMRSGSEEVDSSFPSPSYFILFIPTLFLPLLLFHYVSFLLGEVGGASDSPHLPR